MQQGVEPQLENQTYGLAQRTAHCNNVTANLHIRVNTGQASIQRLAASDVELGLIVGKTVAGNRFTGSRSTKGSCPQEASRPVRSRVAKRASQAPIESFFHHFLPRRASPRERVNLSPDSATGARGSPPRESTVCSNDGSRANGTTRTDTGDPSPRDPAGRATCGGHCTSRPAGRRRVEGR